MRRQGRTRGPCAAPRGIRSRSRTATLGRSRRHGRCTSTCREARRGSGGGAGLRPPHPDRRDAADLGRAAPDTLRHVVVGLALRDRDGLEALLARVHDSASPGLRRFPTAAEFAAAHGPSPDVEARVVAYLVFARVAEHVGGAGPGAPTPALYALCGTPAFHDVTMGSNGTYGAAPGYDEVTGLGTPDVRALLALYRPGGLLASRLTSRAARAIRAARRQLA